MDGFVPACSVVSNFYDSMDCSPPGSSVHGTSQARVIDWVAISSLWGIFPIQGSNLHLLRLLHYRWILYHWVTRETRIHLQVIFEAVGKKSFWNNKLLFLCRQFCGLLFGGTNLWWFVLLGSHSHWWSLVRAGVHGLLGTWPHSRTWVAGKWAKLCLYLLIFLIAHNTAWALPPFRSTRAFWPVV